EDGLDEIRRKLTDTSHSRLPVSDGGADTMIGVLQTREALSVILSGGKLDVRALVREAPIVPDSMDAMRVLETLRGANVPMLLVHDEYGHFEGILTPGDVLEAIAGVFRSDIDEGETDEYAVLRQDGSWFIDGAMPIDEMAERLGIALPERRNYHTAAGLVIEAMQHLPKTGETVEAHGWCFEVVDLDGRRIDKILASRLPA
ncbi:CBS domain-containing protein, partial [Rhizobium sp. TRM95111]|uniref:transporter associated domain-containing protein n=1 Tax=Rhizobium alarense TaxID=2846851 RepID=UPI001F40EE80